MERRAFVCLATAACLALGHVGCGPPRPTTAPKAAKFPAYGAAEAAIFGDTIAEDFLGGERAVPAHLDERLGLRVRTAAVFAARITTVNRDSLGDEGPHYSITAQPVGPVLAGQDEAEAVTLLVPPASASYTWVRTLETALVGRPLILFMKRYNDAGVARIHWHLEADVLPVRIAVERAKMLREVRQ
jgi:hypothetical protein